MLILAPRAIEDALQGMKKGLLKTVLARLGPQYSDKIKEALNDLIQSDGQTVENQVSSRYEINDRNAEIIINVSLGPISGPYTANISGSSKVTDHSRSYEDSRPWEFPDGHWETLNHIPPAVALEKGWEALGYK
jgi:hypothetical protein